MTAKTKHQIVRLVISLLLAATLLGGAISWTLLSSDVEKRSTVRAPVAKSIDHNAALPQRELSSAADLEREPLPTRDVAEPSTELRVQFFDKETELPLMGVTVATDSAPAAVSDEDGVAFVSVIAPQLVSYVREGYWARTVLLEGHDSDDLERVEYLTECGEILGTVSDTTGRLLEDVSVRIVESGGPPGLVRELASVTTDPDGTFALALPGHVVAAQHMDLVVDARGSTGWRRNVSVLGGGDTSRIEVEVVLQVSATVEGRVTASNGKAVTGAELTLRPLDSLDGPISMRTGRDGSYRFESIPAGDFEMTVFASRRAPRLLAGTVEATESVVIDVLLESGDVLRGTVLDDQGRVVAGARVEATLEEGSFELTSGELYPLLSVLRPLARRSFRSALTDAHGKFELRHLPREAFFVLAEAKGYRPSELQRDGSEGSGDVSLLLEPFAKLAGTVTVAETREPPRDVDVQVRAVSEERHSGPPTVFTRGSGQFECLGLPAGLYSIRVLAPGYRPHEDTVQLAAGGELNLELQLQRGRQAAGIVFDDATDLPVVGATVSVCRDAGGREQLATAVTVYSEADGSFELSGLDDGPYVLSVRRAGYTPDTRQLVVDDLREPLKVRLPPSAPVQAGNL